jgi:adenylate cyclase
VRTRISLRNKLLIFAILIAVVPLVVAERSMIRVAHDELKSSANGELVAVAEQLVRRSTTGRNGRGWPRCC